MAIIADYGDEPRETSFLEAVFHYKEYKCVVLFHNGCWRCGYVRIPKDSAFYGASIDTCNDYLDCHGGITYSEDYLKFMSDPDVWWIGFDCTHCNDGYDFDCAEIYFRNDPYSMSKIKSKKDMEKDSEYEPRTLDYVVKECCSLVDQLYEASEVTEIDMAIRRFEQ